MLPRVLLVNPPICDFTAYDFWLRPYGLLSVAGRLRGRADMRLFDYMDRSRMPPGLRRDDWGRGEYQSQIIAKPSALKHVPRRFRRFGRPRGDLQAFVRAAGAIDFVLVPTGMTYWYGGLAEVIEDIRMLAPAAKIILGGVYATLCPAHARGLGADLVVEGTDLSPLWGFIGVEPDLDGLPVWELAIGEGVAPAKDHRDSAGVIKITEGCPFSCTYCSVPRVYGRWQPRPAARAVAELELLHRLGVRNVAFYDDSLLYRAEDALLPMLGAVADHGWAFDFHTPNALNARFITADLARRLVAGGFRTFHLGIESESVRWQAATGGKVTGDEFTAAVEHLRVAGAPAGSITAYIIAGHPGGSAAEVEATIRRAAALGVRAMLAEFSPIPGTPDGDACSSFVDMAEPLCHNKTVFASAVLGEAEMNRLKKICRVVNDTSRQ